MGCTSFWHIDYRLWELNASSGCWGISSNEHKVALVLFARMQRGSIDNENMAAPPVKLKQSRTSAMTSGHSTVTCRVYGDVSDVTAGH